MDLFRTTAHEQRTAELIRRAQRERLARMAVSAARAARRTPSRDSARPGERAGRRPSGHACEEP
ncbi:hypothetical protein AAH978_15860 [Streptomyces sp. ZYX-F-203]